MANELSVDYPTPSLATIYFVVGQAGNKRYNTSGTPAFETTNLSHWPQYAVAGSDAGAVGTYEATFPASIPIGTLVAVYAYLKAGGSPASSDLKVGGGGPYRWNGVNLVPPSDVESNLGTGLLAKNGVIASATGTGVVLSASDPLVVAASNLQGYTINFLGKSTHGIITDAGTTATRVVAGGWQNGPTPSAGDTYSLELAPAASVGPVMLAANGLDAVIVEAGINMRQAQALTLAAAAGVVSGAATNAITIKGAGNNTTRISGVVDADGDRPSVTLTPPA